LKYPITAIVLAGGKSSRMGRDKALLPLQNHQTLSEFQYQKLQKYFKEVFLCAKTDKFSFTENIILDSYTQSSPLAGILSIFETLNIDAAFILGVDIPLLDRYTIKKLWDAYQETLKTKQPNIDAIVAQSPSGLQPLCGIYKKSILPRAQTNYHTNIHQLKALLHDDSTKRVYFEKNTPFTNINTPKEYLNLLGKFN